MGWCMFTRAYRVSRVRIHQWQPESIGGWGILWSLRRNGRRIHVQVGGRERQLMAKWVSATSVPVVVLSLSVRLRVADFSSPFSPHSHGSTSSNEPVPCRILHQPRHGTRMNHGSYFMVQSCCLQHEFSLDAQFDCMRMCLSNEPFKLDVRRPRSPGKASSS
jgi:hypothetical protein